LKVNSEKQLDAVQAAREAATKYTVENLGPQTEMPMKVRMVIHVLIKTTYIMLICVV